MSDAWAMNAGKASTAIGTAVIEADDELFTIASHGLGVGDTVMVDTLTGGAVGVLDEGQVYWVVDVTTNTFALSQHRNGAPVAFSSDGGADVYRFAPQYSAAELRRLFSGLLQHSRLGGSGEPVHTDVFGAKSGVLVPPFNFDVIGVSGTNWTTDDMVASVYKGNTSLSGTYLAAHAADTGPIDPADGAQDRADALDLVVDDDDEDSSGFRRARVEYTAGTPGSGDPAVVAGKLRLGYIDVPAGGSPTPTARSVVPMTVARGGVLPIRDDSERPNGNRFPGLVVWNLATETMEVNLDGSSTWAPLAASGGWQRISNGSGTGASIDVDLTAGGKFPAGTFDTIRLRATGYLSAANQIVVRVNDQTGSNYRRQSLAFVAATPAFGDGEQNQNGTAWLASWWGPTFRNSMTFEMYRCADNVAIPIWHQGGNVEDLGNNITFGTGRYNNSIIPHKLTFECGGNTFSEFVWELEGYRK